MWPPSRRCGRQRRVIRISPLTFVSSTVRSSSSLLASNGSRPSANPAALTRMSSPPSATLATKSSQLSASVTSSRCASTGGSISSALRAPPITRAPARASACAVAAPIPLEAPVTTAVFPSSDDTRRTLTAYERQAASRNRSGRRVLHLQRRVCEAEPLRQQLLEPRTSGMAVCAVADEHVGGDGREAARHCPDVEVVNGDDIAFAGECTLHVL